jgi:hypothetical protein
VQPLARDAELARGGGAEAVVLVDRVPDQSGLGREVFPWATLRYQHTHAILTALVNTVSPRTGRPLVGRGPGARRGPRTGARVEAAPGTALSPHELARLCHVCQEDPTPAGPRDAVILVLGVGAGLRRAEISP